MVEGPVHGLSSNAAGKITISRLNVWFGPVHSLKNVNMDIFANEILSVIGPANSGKTTFLRMLNRLNELQVNFRMEGKVELDNRDIQKMEVELLRKEIGMVFALPTPLPLSIFDNVAYGVRISGRADKKRLKEIVETALRQAY